MGCEDLSMGSQGHGVSLLLDEGAMQVRAMSNWGGGGGGEAVPCVHHLCGAQLRLLHCERHPQAGPPHHHDAKTISLHMLSPARRRLCLRAPLSAAVLPLLLRSPSATLRGRRGCTGKGTKSLPTTARSPTITRID